MLPIPWTLDGMEAHGPMEVPRKHHASTMGVPRKHRGSPRKHTMHSQWMCYGSAMGIHESSTDAPREHHGRPMEAQCGSIQVL